MGPSLALATSIETYSTRGSSSRYSQLEFDMSVKVLGGWAPVQRKYLAKRWIHGPTISPIENPDGSGGFFRMADGSLWRDDHTYAAPTESVCTPGGTCVSKVSTTVNVGTNGTRIERIDADTLRWTDQKGDFVDYGATSGCAIRKGDRNNVTVSIGWEPAIATVNPIQNVHVRGMRGFLCKSGGAWIRIKTLKDHFGATIYTYNYSNADSSLVGVTDYTGRSVTYSYDATHLVGVTDVLGKTWTYSYTDAGDLKTVGRPDGLSVTLTFDGMERLTELRDSTGQWETFKHESLSGGLVYVRHTHSGGRVIERWSNANGIETRMDINGTTVERTVVVSDNEQALYNFSGQKTTLKLDGQGRASTIVHPDGSEESFAYHAKFSTQLIQHRKRNGAVTVFRQDARGNPTQIVEALMSPDQRIVTIEYDEYGQVTKLTLPQSAPFLFEYDNKGNQIRTQDPAGNQTLAQYDVQGLPTQFQDNRGKIWRYEYDRAGHLTRSIDPEGRFNSFVVDFLGNVLSHIDQSGFTRTFETSQHGKITKVVDGSDVQTFAYTGLNLLARQTDGDGNTTNFSYDAPGRLTQIGYGTGERVKFFYPKGAEVGGVDYFSPARIEWPISTQVGTYDRNGRLVNSVWTDSGGMNTRLAQTYDAIGDEVTSTDSASREFRVERDMLRRVRSLVDPDGVRSLVSYDALDNPTSFEDSRGAVTRWEYDVMKRKAKEIKPLLQETRFSYDADGRLTDSKDAKGQILHHEYNDSGRRIRTVMAEKTIDYEYDVRGNLVRWTDGTFTGTYNYDAQGRMTRQQVNYGSFTKGSDYTYTPAGRIRSRTGPDGATINYLFDASGRESVISIPGAGDITNNAFAWANPSSTLYPGGMKRDQPTNGLGYPLSAKVSDVAGKVLLNHEYKRGADGMLRTRIADGAQTDFDYDTKGRLLSYTEDGNIKPLEYDAQGNLVRHGSELLTYNLNNEIQSRGSITYTHDANGNLTSRSGAGAQRYTYDTANRLVKVEDGVGNVLAEFGYDPFDRRLWKKSGGHTTFYYYEAEGLASEMDESGNVTVSYGFWPGSRYGSNPVYQRRGDSYYFYQNDQLGTPWLLVDSAGTVVWKARYGILGAATTSVATVENNLRLPGQYYDAETGLHYNWRRYYDPQTSRYLTPDPNGLMAGLNLYAYTDGDTVNEGDPTGECWWGIISGAATSAVISIVVQKFTNPCADINWWKVGKEAAIGAGIGLVTCGVGKIYQGVKSMRQAAAARQSGRVSGVDPFSGFGGPTKWKPGSQDYKSLENTLNGINPHNAANAGRGLPNCAEVSKATAQRLAGNQNAVAAPMAEGLGGASAAERLATQAKFYGPEFKLAGNNMTYDQMRRFANAASEADHGIYAITFQAEIGLSGKTTGHAMNMVKTSEGTFFICAQGNGGKGLVVFENVNGFMNGAVQEFNLFKLILPH